MEDTFLNRLKKAWNLFLNKDQEVDNLKISGSGSSYRYDRYRLSGGNERSIVGSLYNRLAIDVAAIKIRHVRLDPNGRYLETIPSNLNECLALNTNIDQASSAFMLDAALSLFDEGFVAIVPVDTSVNPSKSNSYEIYSMRIGQILEWMPAHVRVRLYNDRTGLKEDIVLQKSLICIVENPLYSVMNAGGSIIKRLITKLNLLDAIDTQSGSGKLDLIIQLPYIIKTQARKEQAIQRRKDIEDQLINSQYGIAYTDGTEKITQLNRPVDNNLMTQIQYLTTMLYNQLGLTESIFNGTADEKIMLNYYARTIEPILIAITEEMNRKFLTKTARTQGQAIQYFRDPFKLVPATEIATIADSFTRNAILSSNDIRAIIGYKPSTDPSAEELSNKNIKEPQTSGETSSEESIEEDTY